MKQRFEIIAKSFFGSFLFLFYSMQLLHADSFTDAIRRNDFDSVNHLLESKINLESKENGMTPLMIAACNRNIDMVKLLISYQADVNATTQSETMLNLISRCSTAEIVSLFFRSGLDKKKKVFSRRLNRSPIFIALTEKNFEIADVLLDHGFDIDEPSYNGGKNPLSYFSELGKKDIVEYLIQRKANVNHRAQLGYTPIMFAAVENQLEIAKILIAAGADLNAISSDESESTALSLAKEKKWKEMEQLLLLSGAKATP